jgi:hypothetical protein
MSVNVVVGERIQDTFDIILDEPEDPLQGLGCWPWADRIQSGYNDAKEIVKKARLDIETVLRARPGVTDSTFEAVRNWDRIVSNMEVFFGFGPNKDGTIDQTHLDQIRFVYDRMHNTLQGSVNALPLGHNNLYKPVMACHDTAWTYLDPDDEDPTSPGNTVGETHPELDQGAWYWKQHFVWFSFSTTTSPGICAPGDSAVTIAQMDVITLCDKFLGSDEAAYITLTEYTVKGSTEDGADHSRPSDDEEGSGSEEEEVDYLDDIAGKSLGRTLVHEFAHYYGFRGFNEQGDALEQLIDQQAVNENGDLLFEAEDGMPTTDNTRPPLLTYDFTNLENLARLFENKPDAPTGPAFSTKTADSYAYFALASYFDGWDWALTGAAEMLPRNKDELTRRSPDARAVKPVWFKA